LTSVPACSWLPAELSLPEEHLDLVGHAEVPAAPRATFDRQAAVTHDQVGTGQVQGARLEISCRRGPARYRR
jgi:hypothetical protein